MLSALAQPKIPAPFISSGPGYSGRRVGRKVGRSAARHVSQAFKYATCAGVVLLFYFCCFELVAPRCSLNYPHKFPTICKQRSTAIDEKHSAIRAHTFAHAERYSGTLATTTTTIC